MKDLSDFGTHRGSLDGKQSYCRDCYAAVHRDRREREGLIVTESVAARGRLSGTTLDELVNEADGLGSLPGRGRVGAGDHRGRLRSRVLIG